MVLSVASSILDRGGVQVDLGLNVLREGSYVSSFLSLKNDLSLRFRMRRSAAIWKTEGGKDLGVGINDRPLSSSDRSVSVRDIWDRL
jgi:hypothetical protein